MYIQTIGDLQLMLYIDKRELQIRGITAGDLGLREVLLLTREACQESGITLGRLAEIEAYPERHGALVFIRLEPSEKEWFCFPELPQALDGLQALQKQPSSELVWHNGAYHLSASCPSQQAVLSEFGRMLDDAECAELEENGTLILDQTALEKLWQKLRSVSQ